MHAQPSFPGVPILRNAHKILDCRELPSCVLQERPSAAPQHESCMCMQCRRRSIAIMSASITCKPPIFATQPLSASSLRCRPLKLPRMWNTAWSAAAWRAWLKKRPRAPLALYLVRCKRMSRPAQLKTLGSVDVCACTLAALVACTWPAFRELPAVWVAFQLKTHDARQPFNPLKLSYYWAPMPRTAGDACRSYDKSSTTSFAAGQCAHNRTQ
jgi:hypothetical protein